MTLDEAQVCVLVEMTASDHQPRWTVAELQEALTPDAEPELVRAAVYRLKRARVIRTGGDDEAWAKPSVRYLARLGLIEG